VDLRFTDLPGLWQHFSITLPEVGTALFEDGIGFDGPGGHPQSPGPGHLKIPHP